MCVSVNKLASVFVSSGCVLFCMESLDSFWYGSSVIGVYLVRICNGYNDL